MLITAIIRSGALSLDYNFKWPTMRQVFNQWHTITDNRMFESFGTAQADPFCPQTNSPSIGNVFIFHQSHATCSKLWIVNMYVIFNWTQLISRPKCKHLIYNCPRTHNIMLAALDGWRRDFPNCTRKYPFIIARTLALLPLPPHCKTFALCIWNWFPSRPQL